MAQGIIAKKTIKTSASRNRVIWGILLAGGIFLPVFVVLSVAGIQVWDYTNSVAFCTNACHDVHPEEPVAYQDSYHAQVRCTECHMGRVSTLRGMVLKSSHVRHLPEVILNQYERPLRSETMRPASESCERCHSSLSSHDDMAREIEHFLPDENNTAKRTYMLLRTGAGTQKEESGYGIHWHITNAVEYVASDDQKQQIRWVRTTLADGRTVEYNDVTAPLSPEEIAKAEIQSMDCADCHNRIGHPFPSPEELIDRALAEGRLSSGLPFAKKEMVTLLSANYDSQAEALSAADLLRTRYSEAYPEASVTQAAEIEDAVQLAKELFTRLVFEEPGVTWQSFLDNNGHNDSAGCFRCHDGKHLSAEGEVIRLQCNLCHSIPMTVDADAGPPEMPLVSLQEPASHLVTTFVSDHRFQASDACAECHGEVRFGRDDSSFCANSACHARDWPVVDLDAIFSHPLLLEGGHAKAACYDCHDGVKNVTYECVTCHEPLAQPHYGTACEDCHTPAGFQLAQAGSFEHPMELEGKHAPLGCASCHISDQSLVSACSACHAPPQGHLTRDCNTCHTPLGWDAAEDSAVVRASRIPHALPADENCIWCHDPVGQNWPAPTNHTNYYNEQCTLCHPAGEQNQTLFDPNHTSYLMEGKHAQVRCVECHVDGGFRGTPQECFSCHQDNDVHVGQLGQDCARCHTPEGWRGAAFDHALTTYLLAGAHSQAACAQCHPNNVYDGTPQDCYACHQQKDVHAGQFGRDCAQCHTPDGWREAAFDHALTTYLLIGAHSQVACVQCHPNNVYNGTPQTCYACHQQQDIHTGQFGQGCAQCHTPEGWRGAAFDHALTTYLLTGAHLQVTCAQCHPNNIYDGTPQDCYACHVQADIHAGQFGQNCAQCHTPEGWGGAAFDHALTTYLLTGAHLQVTCAQCHPNNVYDGTPQTCYACHQQQDIHTGQFGQNCAQCHTPEGWSGATLDHALTGFVLAGAHTQVACVQCHPNNIYDGTPQTCYACHVQADIHAGQFGQNCAQCHTPEGWGGATFDHALTDFILIGAHVQVACVQCHPNNVYEGTPQTCYACHQQQDVHAGGFGQNCAQCHVPNGWGGATFNHAVTAFPLTGAHTSLGCTQCHVENVYQGTPKTCLACHQEPAFHAGQLGSDCATCHATGAWIPATYSRSHTFPFNHGEGGSNACQTCHPASLPAYTCYSCHEHQPSEIEHKHREEGIPDFQNCMTCHPTGREGDGGEDDD